MIHRLSTRPPKGFSVVRAGFRLALALVAGSFVGQMLPLSRAAEPKAEMPVEFLYGEFELFPSVLVSTTSFCTYVPEDEKQEGDRKGVISVRVRSPAPNTRVRVTIAETPYFAESSVEVALPKANENYLVAPTIRYDHEKLAALKQPVANLVLQIKVELVSGAAPKPVVAEYYPQIVVHSVNDWLVRYKPRVYQTKGEKTWRRDGVWNSATKNLVAAFVNENSPLIDRVITKRALDRGIVKYFRGYHDTTDKNNVGIARVIEISEIYEALHSMGFSYSSVSLPSVLVNRAEVLASAAAHLATPFEQQIASINAEDSISVASSYVRLPSDTMAARQATGLEGALLLASVYRKLKLHTVIMMFHDTKLNRARALLGVYSKSDSKEDSLIVLDPELLGTAHFDCARDSGAALFATYKEKLHLSKDSATGGSAAVRAEAEGYLWIDLARARADGVLPIPEFAAEKEP
jgi:hypothetical protein